MIAPEEESRVLVLAPIGRDGQASAELLRKAGLRADVCRDLADLVEKIQIGAAAVFVAEEALFGKTTSALVELVERQPAWSDLPIIMLTSHRIQAAVAVWRQRTVRSLGNVSLLERPIQAITLTATLQAAVRARMRQYQVRSLLAELAQASSILEAQVVERTRALEEANTALHEQITERTKIEENLRQAQKMEAVGQLTGGLAHDFNNLLAGISGSIELLQTRIKQGRLNDLDRFLLAAQGAAKRAAALIHRLLAFSRRQTLEPRPTNVNHIVAGMEDLIRRTVGPLIEMEFVGAAGLWTTLIDPPQLESALLNLCINARDAMPNGGRITVETANKWLDGHAAPERDLSPGQYISLCVTDTGTGMPPEVISRAFDPFFTTKPIGEGTGLGLSMIYGFVRQSSGQVRIYSELGQGTTVCLYFPRQYAEAEAPDILPDVSEAPRVPQGRTVLIVDDEPTVRMLVTEVLGDLGYATVEAADSAAGLKILQSNLRLDLLITDVGLPGGMNGRQLADAGRTGRPGLKVLFITGYAENAALGNGHLDPGMHVLTKPFVMETLADRINTLLTTD